MTHRPVQLAVGLRLRRIRDGAVYIVNMIGDPVGSQVGLRREHGTRLWWIQTHRIYREFHTQPKGTDS